MHSSSSSIPTIRMRCYRLVAACPRLSYPGVANPDQELYGMEGRTYNFDQKYARHAENIHGSLVSQSGATAAGETTLTPNVAYANRADFIANITNSVGPTYGNGDYTAKMYQIGGFAQTDWRARNDFTLNLGVLRLLFAFGPGG